MTPLQHLLTAERVRLRAGWDAQFRPDLALGAIAPDAHRVTTRAGHRDLHFRSRKTQDRRLIDFLRGYLRPAVQGEPGALEFWAGWLCHVVADDVWRHSLQRDLPGLWDGVVRRGEGSDELRRLYAAECDAVDIALYEEYSAVISAMRRELLDAHPTLTIEPLNRRDLHSWRLTVVQSMLPPLAQGSEEPEFITVDFVERCMFQAEEETYRILEWEIEEPELSPIF